MRGWYLRDAYVKFGFKDVFKVMVDKGSLFAVVFFVFGAVGCTSTNIGKEEERISLTQLIEEKDISSETDQFSANGIKYIEENDYNAALDQFNNALRLAPRNSSLNFFAGLSYHLLALEGDEAKFVMAKQGYQRAISLDPSNWIARFHAGLLELDQRNYRDAQILFAETLIYTPDEADVLFYMASASYYLGDLEIADGVLNQLSKIEANSERYLQAAALVKAALNDEVAAEELKKRLDHIIKDKYQSGKLQRRIKDWQRFYDRNHQTIANLKPNTSLSGEGQTFINSSNNQIEAEIRAAEVLPVVETAVETEELESENTNEEAQASSPSPLLEKQMVIVDVVIIRTEEDSSTSQGINLLNGLTVELGSNNQSTAGLSWGDSRSKTVGSFTKTITKALNIPSITYSLNIANSANSRNEILARPTLTALNGAQSEFFSGVTIQAQTLPSTAGGTGEAVSIEQDVGVKLGVTPEIQETGQVKMQVSAERTFLNTPNSNIVGYTSKVETSRTTVNATVMMNFGETLILSGLSEKETEVTRDGVPVLQEIPIVQYLFSQKTTKDFNKSVLLLITPRLPEYVYRSSIAGAKGEANDSNDALDEFRSRYADWFKPYPSWASIFYQLQNNSLYREFRTGDVTMENWKTSEKFEDRLSEMVNFLYY